MIAIPLPFVVALLLSILAMVMYFRDEKDERPAFLFLTLCALTTTIVGLRWSTDITLFRFLQPILASLIPATAWYCFARAHRKTGFSYWHFVPPVFLFVASFTYPFWRPPLDPILTTLYAVYGIALLRLSIKQENIPTHVRLGDIPNAIKAERAAGIMLLLSAMIDGAFAVDFAVFDGRHSMLILTFGHALILPLLAISVVRISVSIHSDSSHDDTEELAPISEESSATVTLKEKATKADANSNSLSEEEANAIVENIDRYMKDRQVYLDPDLTLDRLARKVCIPARQISAAINLIHQRNVSQVINEYRIAHAQALLLDTDDTITQVYLNSGFQTKSNFNREFSRVVERTPSAYRREVKNTLTSR
ncbi:helix-turn-helix domain-containing protein [Marinomonas balearica]|uniref:AraC family transcriptional regulator n=1 Tax=Marinomonas balearica TaxID=491947 RepID=A0A4R6M4W4_9GAMM|nr:AraC family transcriptional regulator [Marinomonas balearica]TDO95775.1 AraC family transcriptional regulator [Marinomonas balearica]